MIKLIPTKYELWKDVLYALSDGITLYVSNSSTDAFSTDFLVGDYILHNVHNPVFFNIDVSFIYNSTATLKQ